MLAALAEQSRPPDEVVYVVRESDQGTNDALDRVETALPLRHAFVEIPGHVPPVQVGTHAARSNVIAVIADDARPDSRWCARIMDHFDSPADSQSSLLEVPKEAGDDALRIGARGTVGRPEVEEVAALLAREAVGGCECIDVRLPRPQP